MEGRPRAPPVKLSRPPLDRTDRRALHRQLRRGRGRHRHGQGAGAEAGRRQRLRHRDVRLGRRGPADRRPGDGAGRGADRGDHLRPDRRAAQLQLDRLHHPDHGRHARHRPGAAGGVAGRRRVRRLRHRRGHGDLHAAGDPERHLQRHRRADRRDPGQAGEGPRAPWARPEVRSWHIKPFEHVPVDSLAGGGRTAAGRRAGRGGRRRHRPARCRSRTNIHDDPRAPGRPQAARRPALRDRDAGRRAHRRPDHARRARRHPLVQQRYPLLAEAAASVASPQIRNMGTVGGNLCQEPRCWYYRTPENRFHCLRKGGERCAALLGENRYHSIFGGVRAALPPCANGCPAHIAIPGLPGRAPRRRARRGARPS